MNRKDIVAAVGSGFQKISYYTTKTIFPSVLDATRWSEHILSTMLLDLLNQNLNS
jgi:hypothetical protein